MSRIEIVTSFSPAGADLYGRRCVARLRHWPHAAVAYVDAPLALPVPTRLTTEIPDWPATRARLPHARPDAPIKPTNYRWDAQRFAVKPFVWLDAALRLGAGILLWLDGDTVTTRAVPSDLVEDVLEGADVAYLGRGSMHPETGAVAFRVPAALPLLTWCRDAYRDGAYRTLMDGWTDCHVLRAGLQAVSVRARDLTAHVAGEWRSSVDAMARSPWGPYVSHLKGAQRKREAA